MMDNGKWSLLVKATIGYVNTQIQKKKYSPTVASARTIEEVRRETGKSTGFGASLFCPN